MLFNRKQPTAHSNNPKQMQNTNNTKQLPFHHDPTSFPSLPSTWQAEAKPRHSWRRSNSNRLWPDDLLVTSRRHASVTATHIVAVVVVEPAASPALAASVMVASVVLVVLLLSATTTLLATLLLLAAIRGDALAHGL
jgi:hypothetical protein